VIYGSSVAAFHCDKDQKQEVLNNENALPGLMKHSAVSDDGKHVTVIAYQGNILATCSNQELREYDAGVQTFSYRSGSCQCQCTFKLTFV
jgi:6-phosphogluconolactonase (cycloisomerase 2 family)